MLGQFCWFSGEPNKHVGVEQDHFVVLSHSTGIGDSISPTILTFPVMNPKMSFFADWPGTTLTTGAPPLLTMTPSPVPSTFLSSSAHPSLQLPPYHCHISYL